MAPDQRNTAEDRAAARRAAASSKGRKSFSGKDKRGDSGLPEEGWIWGRHAALAALGNPRRTILEVRSTRNAIADIEAAGLSGLDVRPQLPGEIDSVLPEGAVHQGIAVRAKALEPETLNAIADPTHGLLVVLDQITDPHNAGAIFRSAAAFGARAVIMQDRKSPPLFGTLCKSAVGCAETVGHVRVTNIADTLIALRQAGRFVIGLAGEAECALADLVTANAGPGLVLVMGAEDKGLRPRVAEHCDALARIPMGPKAESLNVSNAAAIALYEAARHDPRINPKD